MRLSDKVRLVGEVLGSLRRSAPDLSTARARYDPMLQSLADRLAAEFGVTWTDEQEAELDQSGRRWHYTTKVLRCDQALNVFPDWSSRYARVVESVATVGVLGTSGDDGTGTRGEPGPIPAKAPQHEKLGDIEIEFEALNPEDLGPCRTTRDALGGDLELDITEGRTYLQISARVAPTN